MSIFSKLFGGGAAPEPVAPMQYNDFLITPAPQKESQGYRIGAVIEKDGKTHTMIRADTYAASDTAVEASIAKAKQVIDQLGDRLFG